MTMTDEKILEGLDEIRKVFMTLAMHNREIAPDQSYKDFTYAEICRKAAEIIKGKSNEE